MHRRIVQFMDTSVLLEVLNVPGKTNRHEEIKAELADRVRSGISLILPTGVKLFGMLEIFAR
jgi:hypothetical protein